MWLSGERMTPGKASAREHLLLGFQAKDSADPTETAVSTAKGGWEHPGISACLESSHCPCAGLQGGTHVRDGEAVD